MLMCVLFLIPQAAYAEQADGEYTIGFNIMHADKKNASIAEGYWNQPAKLFIKDGNIRVQTTINKHAWVTAFATSYNGKMSEVKTISVDEAADERLTEFQIANLTDLVESNVSVTIDSIDYDHSYTMYFKFKPETLKLVKAAEEPAPDAAKPAGTGSSGEKPAATLTPTPKATTAPTSTPVASAAVPTASIEPSPSAVTTDPTTSDPVPTPEPDGQELIESSTTPDPTAAPAEVENDGETEAGNEPSSANNDNQSEESAESVESKDTKRSGNGLIITLVLVVLLAAAAAIVYKIRQNKK